jgi:hypothetical protein
MQVLNDIRRFPFLSQLVAVIVCVAIGLAVWFAVTANGGKTPRAGAVTTSSSLPRLSHRAYALLYADALVHKTRISVLAKWPRPPYQHYRAGDQNCYEWYDRPVALYNLCFVNGLLTDKEIE